MGYTRPGFHTDGETRVFWDVEDYPIPDGLDPASIYQSIKEAIWNHGIHAEVSIYAFADKETFSHELERKYAEAGFKLELLTEGGKHARDYAMFAAIKLWSLINPEPSNVIVLARLSVDELALSMIPLWHTHRYCVLLSDAKQEWKNFGGSAASFLRSIFHGSQYLDASGSGRGQKERTSLLNARNNFCALANLVLCYCFGCICRY